MVWERVGALCVRLIYVITVSKAELHLLHIRLIPHAGGCCIMYFVVTAKTIIVGEMFSVKYGLRSYKPLKRVADCGYFAEIMKCTID